MIIFLVVVGSVLAIVWWSLRFVSKEREREVERAEREEKPAEPEPESEPVRTYIDNILSGTSGPTGIPGSFSDSGTERRYIELVRQADMLEKLARLNYNYGADKMAHSLCGHARALREAAWRLQEGKETIWASDWLLERTRQEWLDENVRVAIETMRKQREP